MVDSGRSEPEHSLTWAFVCGGLGGGKEKRKKERKNKTELDTTFSFFFFFFPFAPPPTPKKNRNGYTVFFFFFFFFFSFALLPPPPRSVHTAARVRSLVLGLSGQQLQREAPMYLRIYLGKTPKTPKVASNRKLKNWGLWCDVF